MESNKNSSRQIVLYTDILVETNTMIFGFIPPVIVSVANSYSATVNPALLCAVTLRWYHCAGSRSPTPKLAFGLTLLAT